MSDHLADFLVKQELVRNLRNVLPPLTPAQAQLVGLYILNAYWLGKGEDFETFPVLRDERPALRVVK